MTAPFLYDTHYQLDKPFALLHLTLDTASPTTSSPDYVLARSLARNAKSRPVISKGEETPWRINEAAMKYWTGNCKQAGLLSRQNAYDYWLMNFVWAETFAKDVDSWGRLQSATVNLSRLLLFRWAWLHDAAMLAALVWHIANRGPCGAGAIVDGDSKHVEEMVTEVLAVLRETSQDIRVRTDYRHKMEQIARNGFRYNSRRHKIVTHLSLLEEATIIQNTANGFRVPHAVGSHLEGCGTMRDCIRSALASSPFGPGGELFFRVAASAFEMTLRDRAEMSESAWLSISDHIRLYWESVRRWDRKFLGILPLAEFFVVRNLAVGRELWAPESWKPFLVQRAKQSPDELTVHVGRFGDVQYLRLTDD